MADALPRRGSLRNLTMKGGSLALERAGRFGLVVVAASRLGEASFGRFVFASAANAVLSLALELGVGLWTTRALARDPGARDAILRVGLRLRLATVPLHALAVAALAAVTPTKEGALAVVYLGGSAMAAMFTDQACAVLRGIERFDLEAQLVSVRALLLVAMGATALAYTPSLAAFCAAFAASGTVSLAHCALLGRAMRGTAARGSNAYSARRAVLESLPIWAAGLLALAYFKVDSLLLPALAGDVELGAYGAAYKLFEGTMMAPSVLLSVAFPRLAGAHGDHRVQSALERRVGVGLLLAGLAAAVTLGLGADPLVGLLYGVAFSRARDSLRVLSLGVPLLFLNFGLTHFLVARDRLRALTVLNVAMLAITLALDLALIPRWAGPGAAWATVLTEAALTVGCLLALRRRTAARTRGRTTARRDRRAG